MYDKDKIEKIRAEREKRKSLTIQQKKEYLNYFAALEKRFNLSRVNLPLDCDARTIAARHHELNNQICRKYQIAESFLGILELDPRWESVKNKINKRDLTENIVAKYSLEQMLSILNEFRENESKDMFFLLDEYSNIAA